MDNELTEALEVLGLSGKPTADDVKKAFRKLSLKYHPDKCCEKRKKWCHKRFIEINNARKTVLLYLENGYSHIEEDAFEKQNKEYMDNFKRFYENFII
jgi:DnaJ-class molecular chaperone